MTGTGANAGTDAVIYAGNDAAADEVAVAGTDRETDTMTDCTDLYCN